MFGYNIPINQISWDAISFKLLPTVSEFFTQMIGEEANKLSDTSISVIDTLQ